MTNKGIEQEFYKFLLMPFLIVVINDLIYE